jgi:enoyl-CoA hydratase
VTDALLVWRGDGRHEITLNRPDRRNAINRELNSAIVAALRAFDADAQARVAVLTGADPGFCAGMDLSDLSWADHPPGDRGDTFTSVLRAVRKPVIAAVNGPAITGGFELALGADFILASERAFFGDTHARVGVFPGGGMTVYLAEAVGVRRARQMSYTGELIGAREALRLGLANEVLPHGELLPRARELATAIAAVDASFLTDLRVAYQRRGNLGVDDALDAERADSSRREISADAIAASRGDVITRGHRRVQSLRTRG